MYIWIPKQITINLWFLIHFINSKNLVTFYSSLIWIKIRNLNKKNILENKKLDILSNIMFMQNETFCKILHSRKMWNISIQDSSILNIERNLYLWLCYKYSILFNQIESLSYSYWGFFYFRHNIKTLFQFLG